MSSIHVATIDANGARRPRPSRAAGAGRACGTTLGSAPATVPDPRWTPGGNGGGAGFFAKGDDGTAPDRRTDGRNKQMTSYAAGPASAGGGGAAALAMAAPAVAAVAWSSGPRAAMQVSTVNANGGTGAAGSGLGASGCRGGGIASSSSVPSTLTAAQTLSTAKGARSLNERRCWQPTPARVYHAADGRGRHRHEWCAARCDRTDLFATLQAPMLTLPGRRSTSATTRRPRGTRHRPRRQRELSHARRNTA